MKVKWRKHEIITVTILVTIGVIGYFWDAYNITPRQISTVYAPPYRSNDIPFNYYYNILSPQIGTLVLFYLTYIWINLLITQNLVSGKSKTFFDYGSLVIQFLLMSFLLALGINVATYFAHPHFYNYGGFKLFTLFGYNDQPLKNIFAGFDSALILVVIYGVYALVREYLTYEAERSGTEKSYRILIINHATALLIIYICLPVLSLTFNLVTDEFTYRSYFTFITSTFLVYFSNIYWLFPTMAEKSFVTVWFLSRLVLSTLIYCLPITLLITHQGPYSMLWLANWMIQLLVITPVSWLIFDQRKDQLKQLRVVQKALTRSNADLQLLKSQINPHFLFNAMNTLYGIALTDGSKRTADGVQKLGDMMRFMLHDNHLDFIPTTNEIAYLKNYILFQKLRLQTSDDLYIEDDIHEDNCLHLIAPMLLIPFVENAFKHGIGSNGKSWIKIKLTCDAKMIHFEVRNTIHEEGKNDPEKDQSGIGLENVRERLRILYPGKHELIYGPAEQEFVVNLILEPHSINPE